MNSQYKDICTFFKIVNKKPNYSSQERLKKRDSVRADLYKVYKKYM
jgi:hypothetical protein